MTGKNKCKYCGAAADIKDGMIFGQCGTWEVLRAGAVYRNSQCERDELQQRIDAAVNRAERATRFGVEPGIIVICASDFVDIVEILRGNSPINLEGSDG